MKRFATFITLAATLGACSYGPLYRGPVQPNDARIRRLGYVAGTGTGYNAGIAAGRANEEAWDHARACGAEQVVDVYEEGDCIEPIRWVLFFLPSCSAAVRGVAVTYKAQPDPAAFQRCVRERNGDG